MMRTSVCCYVAVVCFLLSGCRYGSEPEVKNKKAASEFSFLYGYVGRKPADVGMFTNHIVTIRLANLLKGELQGFIAASECAGTISMRKGYIISDFYSCGSTQTRNAIFVASDSLDAIWLGVIKEGKPLIYAERTSLPYPDGIDSFIANAKK
jgi:hypothetical protein